MDSVRFGRALGLGARGAAKALAMAADAAAAPRPAAGATSPKRSALAPAARLPASPAESVAETAAKTAAETVASTLAKTRATQAGLTRGSKQFGEAAWGPFVRLSGVLWLEFTGVFFGLFAVMAVASAWKLRSSLHATALNHGEHQRLLWSVAMAAVFGYFCVSSFVRAKRREQGSRRKDV